MAKGVGAKPADLTETLAGVKIYSGAEVKALVTSGELATQIKGVSDTLLTMGKIKAAVELSKLADLSNLD